MAAQFVHTLILQPKSSIIKTLKFQLVTVALLSCQWQAICWFIFKMSRAIYIFVCLVLSCYSLRAPAPTNHSSVRPSGTTTTTTTTTTTGNEGLGIKPAQPPAPTPTPSPVPQPSALPRYANANIAAYNQFKVAAGNLNSDPANLGYRAAFDQSVNLLKATNGMTRQALQDGTLQPEDGDKLEKFLTAHALANPIVFPTTSGNNRASTSDGQGAGPTLTTSAQPSQQPDNRAVLDSAPSVSKPGESPITVNQIVDLNSPLPTSAVARPDSAQDSPAKISPEEGSKLECGRLVGDELT
jgi:hypothetical protein